MKSFILFLYFVLLTLAQPKSEAVNHLPGYSGLLPTTWYSGLLPCGKAPGIPHGDMFMHYIFVESQKDPENAPIVMWMNGGPGASSMFGLFVELGPLELNINSLLTSQYNLTKLPSLIQNIFSWNSFSNLLIFDSPPPVGFSYCEPSGPKGDPTSCGPWNDTTTANANYEALKSWAKKFPNFSSEKKQRDFFITGESYAGVYVPNLAEKVLDNPIPGIHLAGFAVGDGCMGIDVVCGNGKPQGPFYFLEFMYGHGQISNKLYNEIREKCPTANLKNNSLSPECQTLTKQAHEEVGGYYGYNLYDNCGENNIFAKSALANVYPYNSEHFQPSKITGVTRMGYPCPGPAMGEWISRTDVRHDLHVDPASNFFSGDNGVGFNYSLTEKNVLPFYERVLKTTNLRVLVYNGDADPGLNSFLTQDAYSNFFELQKFDYQKWRPWTLDGKTFVGGYVFSYKPKEKNSWNFHYLTIRGSGHMVPEFMPRPARSFMEDFVMGREFPNYIP